MHAATTDEPAPTIWRVATLTLTILLLSMTVPATELAPGVPDPVGSAEAMHDCPVNITDRTFDRGPGPTDCLPCHDDCVPGTDPCSYLPDCDPDPGEHCRTVYKLLGDLGIYRTADATDCIPDPSTDPCDYGPCGPPPVPDHCNYANLCLYRDTLLSEFQSWDAQRDGYPNPTLDCAEGPTIPWVDTDGDGTLDPVDDDRDCDHISDDLEYEMGLKPLNRDSDDDGVVDTRDLTPTTNTPVAAVVRAVEFALLNWDTGPSDAFAPDDPFLRDGAGITNDDGDPMGTELLSVGMMTETGHLHNSKVYDYVSEADRKTQRDDTIEFSQDVADYALKPCLDCYPKLEFHFPIHDHDLECSTPFSDICGPGHYDSHESDAENERYVYKNLGWTLLRLSAASSEAWSIDKLRGEPLSGHEHSITYDSGNGWSIEFTIKRATNTSPCGVINALLGSLGGSGSDDYVTVTEFRNAETDTGYDCPKV